jgi:hypothetical protein
MAGFLFEFGDPQTGCRVVIEDDGRVAYAYLLDASREIISDVWLYNRSAAPEEPDWDRRPSTAFLNPLDYVRTDLTFELPDDEAEFAIGWHLQNSADPKVNVQLRNQLWATMAPGAKPGCCRLAKMDGPLARLLPLGPLPTPQTP